MGLFGVRVAIVLERSSSALSRFWSECLPASGANEMLEIDSHLLIWRDARRTMRTCVVERRANLLNALL
jgi:hypothetical protein